jgi:hypothetical protein
MTQKTTPFGQSRKLFRRDHIFLPEIDGLLTYLCQNDRKRALIWRSEAVFPCKTDLASQTRITPKHESRPDLNHAQTRITPRIRAKLSQEI